jgi:hypothetical protein
MTYKFPFISLTVILAGPLSARALEKTGSCENSVQGTTLEFKNTGTYYVKRKGQEKEYSVNITKLNRRLKELGLPSVPAKWVLSADNVIDAKKFALTIEKANAKLAHTVFMNALRGYMWQLPNICYRGRPEEVWPLMQKLTGSIFHPDQGFLAVRYGSQQKILSDELGAATRKEWQAIYGEEGADQIDTWVNYNPGSKVVLVMSNLGDQGDGTDLYATAIVPCK